MRGNWRTTQNHATHPYSSSTITSRLASSISRSSKVTRKTHSSRSLSSGNLPVVTLKNMLLLRVNAPLPRIVFPLDCFFWAMEDKITELSSPSSGSRRRMHISHQDSTQTGTTSPPFFPAPQTSTPTAKHMTRRPHHSGGSKLSGIWRPPFERTWSVPEQYATTNTSSPVSKGSSRSSIEQVISREEAAMLAGRKYAGGQQVVIEAPLHSLLKMPSVDRGSKDHINKNMFSALKEDVKYLDDPLVDLSFSPPPSTVYPIQPPSYFQIHPEFGKGAFHPTTAIAGNIYSNPSHFSSQQKFQSLAGTPVEVKLSSCGSPVQFCPLNASNQVGGSAGGIGSKNIRHRIADLNHRQAPCCNTQPNSPTSTRQKSIFGRFFLIRRIFLQISSRVWKYFEFQNSTFSKLEIATTHSSDVIWNYEQRNIHPTTSVAQEQQSPTGSKNQAQVAIQKYLLNIFLTTSKYP